MILNTERKPRRNNIYLNKAMIVGNLTRDPELKDLPSGQKVANFSVATNRTWKDKDGNKQESADFHNVVVFGKMAETVAQYMHKGSQILVEGRIQTRSWENKEGVKQYRTEIVGELIQFGQKPKNSEAREEEPVESEEESSGLEEVDL